MTTRILPSIIVAVFVCGCGMAEDNSKSVASTGEAGVTRGGALASAPAGGEARDRVPIFDPEFTKGGDAGKPATKPTPRKIIYTADVDLIVEDFPKASDAIVAAMKTFGGQLADTDVTGTAGVNRRATWKIRIPVERYDSFLDAVVKLGELQRRQVHSQDVTEEFYDLETRITNKKVEEGRLVKHLEESTGKLIEILAVEKEISRVREEVERMEGRIRLLANLSDLTTVTITATERIGFVPATAPNFATRARRTFESSIQGLKDFLEGFALLVISILPWLPVWIVLSLLVWFLIRRIRRRIPTTPIPTPRPTPA
ncbi:MAG: hypothetical protein JWN86_769 [Planctomycetota bacterium]|nr:hypothetical protein [Planctomycetota bacterium]